MKLKAHFDPKPVNVLAHRHSFHCRNQGPSESAAGMLLNSDV